MKRLHDGAIIIIIIIERTDLGGVMSKDCKDTLQTLKTVTKRECDAKWKRSICQMRSWAELSRSGKLRMKLMRCNRYVDLFEHRLQSKHVIMTVMLSSICRYKNDIVDAGMSKSGGGHLPPPQKCWNVVSLLQVLSKTSVDEVFMHYFEKILSASGGFAPSPSLGSCPWTLLEDFSLSDPLIAHPWKNSCRRPWL